jgi:hypothetical protein
MLLVYATAVGALEPLKNRAQNMKLVVVFSLRAAVFLLALLPIYHTRLVRPPRPERPETP